MQSPLENELARNELVRAGLSFWPGCARPKRGRLAFTVGDSRKSWDVLATVRILEAERLQNETVVDLGAFASEILCCLHRARFTRLVGIDLNPAVRDMPFGNAIEWWVGDMMATGLPSGCAGAVTSISAIEHGFDLERLLAEVARLLRPSGLFVGSTDYWPEKIDTTGQRVLGMDWCIFSEAEIHQFIEAAGRFGLFPIGKVDCGAAARCIDFEHRQYTFGWFALRKAS
jgi:SAM-dependent methyltransferase